MIQKIAIIALTILIFLSAVFACHKSCECNQGSQECYRCKFEDIGSVMDKFKRSCPCPPGYYTQSQEPFLCSKLELPEENDRPIKSAFSPSVNQADKIKKIINMACNMECELKSQDISIQANSYNKQEIEAIYVITDVSLNLDKISVLEECMGHFVHKVQFLDPLINDYQDLQTKYIQNLGKGSLVIKIPLIDVYDLSSSTEVWDDKVSYTINLKSLIGSQDRFIKEIKWEIFVYINRDQVQVLQFNTDLITEQYECLNCIVIADLDIIATVFEDQNFISQKQSPLNYFIGDTMYIKIVFSDPTYTKSLKFISLFYKNDIGQIYDYSFITTHQWEDNSLKIYLPLQEANQQATIQIKTQIDPLQRIRFLQNTEQNTIQSSFQIKVEPNDLNNTQSIFTISSIFLYFFLQMIFYIINILGLMNMMIYHPLFLSLIIIKVCKIFSIIFIILIQQLLLFRYNKLINQQFPTCYYSSNVFIFIFFLNMPECSEGQQLNQETNQCECSEGKQLNEAKECIAAETTQCSEDEEFDEEIKLCVFKAQSGQSTVSTSQNSSQSEQTNTIPSYSGRLSGIVIILTLLIFLL